MTRFRFPSWRRGKTDRAVEPTLPHENLASISHRNVAAYADLREAVQRLLAARNNQDIQIHDNLRRAYQTSQEEPPPQLRQLLNRLKKQDAGGAVARQDAQGEPRPAPPAPEDKPDDD